MSLHNQLLADLVSAMKERNTERVDTLRMLKASLLLVAKDSGVEELSDDEFIKVLQKEAKKRKESITQFDAAGRTDLSDTEKAELVIIDEYLPEMMSDDDIRVVIQEIVDGGTTDFGAVMGQAMSRLKGQADGNAVRSLVEQVLKS